jgi:hypothetical protein
MAGRGAPVARTIAVSPVELPNGLDSVESGRRLLDSLIVAHLVSSGFTVVSPIETGAIWKRLVDSVHGYYSAMTGELDRVKYAAVENGTLRALSDRFHADVWMRPWIEVVTVQFGCGSNLCKEASWDGVNEDMKGAGSGTVPALSLVVNAITITGGQFYHGRAGIQVLRKGKKFQALPPDKILMDPERNMQAIHVALDPLVAQAHQ